MKHFTQNFHIKGLAASHLQVGFNVKNHQEMLVFDDNGLKVNATDLARHFVNIVTLTMDTFF